MKTEKEVIIKLEMSNEEATSLWEVVSSVLEGDESKSLSGEQKKILRSLYKKLGNTLIYKKGRIK